MSAPINDGGPAFPRTVTVDDGIDSFRQIAKNGMSLRDWFAGQCDPSIYNPLDTLQMKLNRGATLQELAEYVANIRLMEADAMIAARNNQHQKP